MVADAVGNPEWVHTTTFPWTAMKEFQNQAERISWSTRKDASARRASGTRRQIDKDVEAALKSAVEDFKQSFR